jgi:hypothetical protein
MSPLNEADTRAKLIDPKIKAAGWGESQIEREHYFVRGRAITGVNRTKVRKVSHDFSIISYINTLGDWQLLGFVAFPSTFGGHIFFATHCQI